MKNMQWLSNILLHFIQTSYSQSRFFTVLGIILVLIVFFAIAIGAAWVLDWFYTKYAEPFIDKYIFKDDKSTKRLK